MVSSIFRCFPSLPDAARRALVLDALNDFLPGAELDRLAAALPPESSRHVRALVDALKEWR